MIGNITSLGPIEQNLSCPNCHSNEIENNGKTIKCSACQTRSIKIKQKIDENKIKLNIIDINGNTFDIVTETSKIQLLLQQCNHEELCNSDLIEHEQVLLVLSDLNIQVRFNPRTKCLIDIIIK